MSDTPTMGAGPPALSVTRTRPRRGVTLFVVAGVVDSITALQLRTTLLTALRTAEPTVVVDLSDAELRGVGALRVLQETLAWAEPWHRLRLVTASPVVDRLLQLSGLAEGVRIFDRIEAALAGVPTPPGDASTT